MTLLKRGKTAWLAKNCSIGKALLFVTYSEYFCQSKPLNLSSSIEFEGNCFGSFEGFFGSS